MNKGKQLLILLGLWFSAFTGVCQIDTTSLKVQIWKKLPAPKIIPVISSKGELLKLTASGCTSGEIQWFDAKSKFLSTGESITKNIVGRVGVICQSKERCPSDTAYFEIDYTFQGKVVNTDESKKVCVGTDISHLVEGCTGEVYWEDGFMPSNKRMVKVAQVDTIKYRFRCLQSDGISKFTSIVIPVLKSTLDDLVLYPNPTFHWLKLKSSGCLTGVKCQIYSIIGQKLYEGWAESNDDFLQINVSNLPSEEYIIELSLPETGERVIKRFIKLNKP
ncbi:MAG: T9SS C-terminal target domain-containing protein [Emticicia sp.]|uniref:T9SS C-terminal target domain-containing protein n=1 Tax=Emticicia sp. TaxID=1930953 RepID=UPI003BA66987